MSEKDEMNTPDFTGFYFDGEIQSVEERLTLLWFSKIDRELETWRQIQLTLVCAQLIAADVEINPGFPPFKSCDFSKKSTLHGDRTLIVLSFDKGQISFQCEDIICTEFHRKIRFG